jgi:hypothetical protein
MAVWSVFVLAGDEALGGVAALDRLAAAMEAQAAHFGFSVAGGAQPSVFLSIEASDVTEARHRAESIVEAALASIDRAASVRATQVYDVDGRIAFDATSPNS